MNNLASRDSHHSNTSVIFVYQHLNFGSGKLRNARVNSLYHTVFKSLTDVRDIEMIAANKKYPRIQFKIFCRMLEKNNMDNYCLMVHQKVVQIHVYVREYFRMNIL